MDKSILNSAKHIINSALSEDLGDWGDITTLATAANNHPARASIIAKQEGVIAGLDLAILVFHTIDENLVCNKLLNDGDYVKNSDKILTIEGTASSMLSAERTALNFIGHLSGIASLTHQFTSKISKTRAKILDTRKTTPGWRLLEKYAVVCGGGMNHRMGLHDMFLIKDNHITHAGGIENAVNNCRNYMQYKHISAPIEVEVKNLTEFKTAVSLSVDRIMLDNMTIPQINECRVHNKTNIPVEVSGNVNIDTVQSIAETGIDFISIGALTHSFKNFDFSMLIE